MTPSRTEGGRVLPWAARAAGWLLTAVLGLLDVFVVREVVVASYLSLRLGKYGFALADKLSLSILGFIWLVSMLYTQHAYGLYSSLDAPGKRFQRLFIRATVIEAAIVLVGGLVVYLLR